MMKFINDSSLEELVMQSDKTGLGYRIVKRLIDLLFSGILLIFLSPVMLIIAILIRVDSKGEIVFTQKRVGRNQKTFTTFKFRTMYKDSSIDNYAAPKSGDARVTKIGKVLRKLSVDELPQLLNVFLGQMSLIGPRAVPAKELELREEKLNIDGNPEINKRAMEVRSEATPGITGMAQAYGRSSLTTLEATKLDIYYVRNTSFLLDCKIFVKSLETVLLKKGVN
ncbi:sugar transferase [uncultured Enterococcus sp.]|uniref:sugar transferase n=1 Tax=uncultured Enterococcus sp. TaxID=167972 RepID=UPI002AA7C0C7|nr:sugar transferase [uncultured Enterococcus sp.]